MKKILPILVLLFALGIFKTAIAQNTYPWSSNGDVGIGTPTPARKLHILTGVAYTGTSSIFGMAPNIFLQGAEAGLSLSSDVGSSGLQTGIQQGHGGMSFGYVASGDYNNLRVGTQSNSHLIFRTNNTDKMVITNTGDAGIGTVNPLGRFHTVLNSTSLSPLVTENPAVSGGDIYATQFRNKDGVSGSVLVHTDNAQLQLNATTNLLLSTAGNERLRITNTGALLVGTTNPDVGGSTTGFAVNNSGATLISTNANSYGSQPLYIDRRGTNNEGAAIMFALGGFYKSGIGITGTSTNAAGGLTFFTGDNTSANERLRVTSSGNVGIGTTTPDSKLTVAGNIHSREVKVSVNAGADFVFEKGYELQKLEELERYIQTNKHLPEIASAEQMKKNGLSLGEMNIKLLQKIEELTLHLIEQNKKLELQGKQLNELQSSNNTLAAEVRQLKLKP